jgi:hypothetical protein
MQRWYAVLKAQGALVSFKIIQRLYIVLRHKARY